jgi:hypothetical protein
VSALTLKIEREVAPTEIAYLLLGTGVLGWAPWWQSIEIGAIDDDGKFIELQTPFESAAADDLVRVIYDDPNEAEGSGKTVTVDLTMQQVVDGVVKAWSHLAAEAQRDMTENLGEADAEAADISLQYAVMSEIVYG